MAPGSPPTTSKVGTKTPKPPSKKPNVVYFLVDNLGMGELSSYNGGALRGATTARIDAFGAEGMMLFNFAPETQCTPSRSAFVTRRYSIRSGNQTVAMLGVHCGLVRWERTLGDIFSEAGYATSIVGKWHVGEVNCCNQAITGLENCRLVNERNRGLSPIERLFSCSRRPLNFPEARFWPINKH
jgi:hypothetical protein